MQAYSQMFAHVYNERWAGFAASLAPHLLAFYAATEIGRRNQSLLDLCCGTGQVARHFLENGYRVTGIDLSDHMLHYARKNTAEYVEQGQARFLQGDAANFALDETFGLVVSTFDALNHLPDFAALQSCFASVYKVLARAGYFIFDLNTRRGLQRWNNINVQEEEDMVIITRGVYDGQSDRAYTHVSGFVQVENGLYQRFAETAYNTVFDMAAVHKALLAAGWRHVYPALAQDLAAPIDEPEQAGRVFLVARK